MKWSSGGLKTNSPPIAFHWQQFNIYQPGQDVKTIQFFVVELSKAEFLERAKADSWPSSGRAV
jgi:hypothetical protein